jgi:hypothetical protein
VLEGTFNAKLRKSLAKRPELKDWVIVKQCQIYHKGVPDFWLSRGRTQLVFEVKMRPEQPTKIQYWHLERMAGFWIQAGKNGKRAALMADDTARVLDYDELVSEIVRRAVNREQ